MSDTQTLRDAWNAANAEALKQWMARGDTPRERLLNMAVRGDPQISDDSLQNIIWPAELDPSYTHRFAGTAPLPPGNPTTVTPGPAKPYAPASAVAQAAPVFRSGDLSEVKALLNNKPDASQELWQQLRDALVPPSSGEAPDAAPLAPDAMKMGSDDNYAGQGGASVDYMLHAIQREKDIRDGLEGGSAAGSPPDSPPPGQPAPSGYAKGGVVADRAKLQALRGMQRKTNFDDGGTVQPETPETPDNAPVGLLAGTPSVATPSVSHPAAALVPSTSSSSTPNTSMGGGQGIGGDHPLDRFSPAPQVPAVNLVSNAYSPALRGLPSPQARQQQAQAAMAPFLAALQRIKSGQ